MPPQTTDLPGIPRIWTGKQPIGVFDSGIGGLTVAAELRKLLPQENIFYIGDTARVPYGGKSQSTIERYSMEISEMLLTESAKMVVVACNTASALAIPKLHQSLEVPVTGVILPGAKAAVAATRNGHVGVIGTRGTIRSGAYERAIHTLAPEVRVTSQACPMLVPSIEEGWLEDKITDSIIARYLDNLVESGIDTLVLGCTHYPLLKPALDRFLGGAIRLVDSAENCALAVRGLLEQYSIAAPAEQEGVLKVALTDASDGFLPVAERALGLKVGRVRVLGMPSTAL
jgi:glutamate racemase